MLNNYLIDQEERNAILCWLDWMTNIRSHYTYFNIFLMLCITQRIRRLTNKISSIMMIIMQRQGAQEWCWIVAKTDINISLSQTSKRNPSGRLQHLVDSRLLIQKIQWMFSRIAAQPINFWNADHVTHRWLAVNKTVMCLKNIKKKNYRGL